jgi:hypothetical protein
MAARDNSLARRIRSTGGTLLRRLNLLPGGTPDGLGDDEQLADAVLDGDVIVYFPDTRDSLYQIRGWYGPLLALHEEMGVTVVCMDSRTAATIRAELPVPVVTVARDATLDALILRSEIRLVLYVNYNPMNMAALRARSVVHVSLLHGDSDKGVSVSNQVKAYDFSFVAGQAAVDRYARYTALFDAATRCIPVGRPALDTQPRPAHSPGRPPRVLYAPTWEGGQASVAYSSLPDLGPTIIGSLLDAGIRVIYRPHPLTGVRVAAFGEADARLRALIEPADGSFVSQDRELWEDFVEADLLLCDVSAVANDWLPTGRPLIITRPSGIGTHEARTELLDVVPRLEAAQATAAGTIVQEQIAQDPAREERLALTEYYLGDTSPGAALSRFLAACRDLAELRDRQWSRILANEADHGENE